MHLLSEKEWVTQSIMRIEADYQRSADTHLVPLKLKVCPDIDIYFKDESTHPSGSLKHRLARSLFLYGLCNGWIKQGKTVVEASSGSTAVSEAYFARIIGVPFVAVVPKSTSEDKIKAIEFYEGKCHFVNGPSEVYEVSRQVAKESGGHYLDQFTYAERATDWRGNNNIAESIFIQMEKEKYPIPKWIIMSAGTGGTSATISRYIRYRHFDTQMCVVDPEYSAFYEYWQTGDKNCCCEHPSRIEGVGRPQVEPSFMRDIIDDMIKLEDCKSIAAMYILSELLNKPVGPSSGANFYGLIQKGLEMKKEGIKGSLVSLICDSGLRYVKTYFNKDWLEKQGLYEQVMKEKELQKALLEIE